MDKLAAALAASVIAVAAQAADKAPASAQPQLQAACSTQANARELQAQERTRFVSACVAEGRKREQKIAKACSEAAAYKQVHERRKFMAECMKG